jgi:hypothetical protein
MDIQDLFRNPPQPPKKKKLKKKMWQIAGLVLVPNPPRRPQVPLLYEMIGDEPIESYVEIINQRGFQLRGWEETPKEQIIQLLKAAIADLEHQHPQHPQQA